MLLWSRTVQSCRCHACSKALGGRAPPAPKRKVTVGDVFTACYSAIFATATLADVVIKRTRRDQWDQAIEEVRSQLPDHGKREETAGPRSWEVESPLETVSGSISTPSSDGKVSQCTIWASRYLHKTGGPLIGRLGSNQAILLSPAPRLYQQSKKPPRPHRSFHTTESDQQQPAVAEFVSQDTFYSAGLCENHDMISRSFQYRRPVSVTPVSVLPAAVLNLENVDDDMRAIHPQDQIHGSVTQLQTNICLHPSIEPIEKDAQIVRFVPTEVHSINGHRIAEMDLQVASDDLEVPEYQISSISEKPIRFLVRQIMAATHRSAAKGKLSIEAGELFEQVKLLQSGAMEYPCYQPDSQAECHETELHNTLKTLVTQAMSSPISDIELMMAKICYNLLVAPVPPRKDTIDYLLQDFDAHRLHDYARILIKSLFYSGADHRTPYAPGMSTLALMLNHFAAVGDVRGFIALTKRMRGEKGGLLRQIRFERHQNLNEIKTVKSGRFISDGTGFVEKTPRDDAIFDSLILGSLRLGRLKAAARYFRAALHEGCDVTAKALLWMVSACVTSLDYSAAFRIIHAIVWQWKRCSFQTALPMFPRVQWHFEALLSLCRANYALLNVSPGFLQMLTDFERFLRLESIDNALGSCSQKILALEDALFPKYQKVTGDTGSIYTAESLISRDQRLRNLATDREESERRLSKAADILPDRSPIASLADRNQRLATFCRQIWLSVFEVRFAKFEANNRQLQSQVNEVSFRVITAQLAQIEENINSLKTPVMQLRWSFDLRQAHTPKDEGKVSRQHADKLSRRLRENEMWRLALQRRLLARLDGGRKSRPRIRRVSLVRMASVVEGRSGMSPARPKIGAHVNKIC